MQRNAGGAEPPTSNMILISEFTLLTELNIEVCHELFLPY